MGLALDEPKENDEVLTLDGFRITVDKGLVEDLGGLTITYRKSPLGGGFIIRPLGEVVYQGCSC